MPLYGEWLLAHLPFIAQYSIARSPSQVVKPKPEDQKRSCDSISSLYNYLVALLYSRVLAQLQNSRAPLDKQKGTLCSFFFVEFIANCSFLEVQLRELTGKYIATPCIVSTPSSPSQYLKRRVKAACHWKASNSSKSPSQGGSRLLFASGAGHPSGPTAAEGFSADGWTKAASISAATSRWR